MPANARSSARMTVISSAVVPALIPIPPMRIVETARRRVHRRRPAWKVVVRLQPSIAMMAWIPKILHTIPNRFAGARVLTFHRM